LFMLSNWPACGPLLFSGFGSQTTRSGLPDQVISTVKLPAICGRKIIREDGVD